MNTNQKHLDFIQESIDEITRDKQLAIEAYNNRAKYIKEEKIQRELNFQKNLEILRKDMSEKYQAFNESSSIEKIAFYKKLQKEKTLFISTSLAFLSIYIFLLFNHLSKF